VIALMAAQSDAVKSVSQSMCQCFEFVMSLPARLTGAVFLDCLAIFETKPDHIARRYTDDNNNPYLPRILRTGS